MGAMRIEQIEVRNYRAFRDVRLTRLSPMTVVVGANGSGKSTLLDVFSFLKESLNDSVASSTARRGGFHELVSPGGKRSGKDHGEVPRKRWVPGNLHSGRSV